MFYSEAGSWAPLPYFTGANLGLTKDSEDIGAAWIDPLTGEIYLATKGRFILNTGLHGEEEDVLVCDPLALWDKTACEARRFWEGDSMGLDSERIDGFSAGSMLPTANVNAARVVDEENVEPAEELIDPDDVPEEGSQEEQEEDQTLQFFLPMITR